MDHSYLATLKPMSAVFTQPSLPQFTSNGTRYDESTYLGRWRSWMDQTKVSIIFVTNKRINEAQELLQKFKSGQLTPPSGLLPPVLNKQLWDAKSIVESTVHPDTKQPIFPLVRFAAFMPMNFFIIPAMLHPAVIKSAPLTILSHWTNQTYNIAINYANANSASHTTTERLFAAYLGACACSCSIALCATRLMRRVKTYNGRGALTIRATIPWAACIAAGITDLTIIRFQELVDGVEVSDDEGKKHGKSRVAARSGLLKCALARVIWCTPTLLVTPIIIAQCVRHPILAGNPRLRFMFECSLLAMSFRYGIPPSIAVFPRFDSIAASDLEPEFHNCTTDNGQKVQRFLYHKGI